VLAAKEAAIIKPQKKKKITRYPGLFLAGDAQSVFNPAAEYHLPELNIARAKAPAQAFR
jgi:hypothetical protein